MRFIFLLFLIVFFGCLSQYGTGHYNQYSQYVPKNPRYELKNKAGLVLPAELDFEGIYKLTSCTYRGETSYPVTENMPYYKHDPCYNVSFYKYFFKNGRVLSFSTPSFNTDGSEYKLKPSDISEKRAFVNKEYWYSSTNSGMMQIESFFSANGQGKYSISNVVIKKGKLIFPEKNDQFQDASIYTLIPLDKSLIHDFQIDW